MRAARSVGQEGTQVGRQRLGDGLLGKLAILGVAGFTDDHGRRGVQTERVCSQAGQFRHAQARRQGHAVQHGAIGAAHSLEQRTSGGGMNQPCGLIVGQTPSDPAAVRLAFARPGSTPGVRQLVAVIEQALADAGVPEGQRSRLERMLTTFVLGFVVSEVSGRFPHEHATHLGRELAADVDDLVGLVRAVAARG